MKEIIFKAGRFLYRVLGLSARQRMNKEFTGNIKDAVASNQMIYEMILSGKPAMISRFGTPESKCLLNFLELQETRRKNLIAKIDTAFIGATDVWRDDVRNDLIDLVGFFPVTDEMLERFAAYYIEQVRKIDAVGIWGFVPGETYLIEKYASSAKAYDPRALEPYYFDAPWSSALKGKTVLVIHPFTSSIQKQYYHLKKLFKNRDILPEFELKTITAVQSIAGNKTEFIDWFAALDSMQKKIDIVDFDVAIIGAGSYGLPLSAYIKEKGKISIHIGGATQILFGIKGKRWDSHPEISKLYNEYWIRPDDTELVLGAQKVEGGCYW